MGEAGELEEEGRIKVVWGECKVGEKKLSEETGLLRFYCRQYGDPGSSVLLTESFVQGCTFLKITAEWRAVDSCNVVSAVLFVSS